MSSARSKVAVLYTNPATVLEDIGRLMHLADYESFLPKDVSTILKVNISWQHYYPSCSSTPWQIEGVARTLLDDGYGELIAGHNGTVVVDSYEGELNNKHLAAQQRLGMKSVHLDSDPQVQWIRYRPQGKMLALDKVYPQGIMIPDTLIGKNIIQLPTMKTHVFTTMTGAMKNAFGGLLHHNRHWCHGVIHETLVDLLAIQKEIHPGVFAVMDGTIAGDGAGPRAMRPVVKNVILASGDLVAIDAIAAKMMGFDPLELKFIRLAHEAGLGCGDVRDIEVVGADISGVNWHFKSEDTFASRGQKAIYWGPLKPLEGVLLRSFITPWSFLASDIYHNQYWHRFIGKERVRKVLEETEWGQLFQSY